MSTNAQSPNTKPDQPWLAYKRAMVIVAHPDDAEFGCSGTLAKMARNGMQIAYVLCTSGDKGSGDPTMTSERLAKIREQEQRNAARVVGTEDVTFLRFGDGELETSREVIGKIVHEIRRFKPDIVICQDPYMRRRHNHRDHRHAGQATFDAVYPYARDHMHFPDQIKKEGLQTHKVAEVYSIMSEEPDVVIDISDVIDVKVEALKQHASQIGDPKGLEERIKNRPNELAQQHGLKHAEGFRRHTFNVGGPQPVAPLVRPVEAEEPAREA